MVDDLQWCVAPPPFARWWASGWSRSLLQYVRAHRGSYPLGHARHARAEEARGGGDAEWGGARPGMVVESGDGSSGSGVGWCWWVLWGPVGLDLVERQ